MIQSMQSKTIELPESDEVHLAEYINIIRDGWRLVVAIAAAFLVVGILYAFLATPVFRADAMIQIEDGTSTANDALGQLASIFDTKQTAVAEIELIRSRLVVGQVVQAMHLDISAKPRYFPLFGAKVARKADASTLATPWFGLGQFAWGGEQIGVSRFDVPQENYDEKFTLVALQDGAYELKDDDGQTALKGHVGSIARAGQGESGIALKVDRLVARPGTQFVLQRASTLDTIGKLQEKMVVAEKTKLSGIVGVTLDGVDSEKIAKIVNTVASAYVQQNIDRKSAQAEHTLGFLQQQLPDLRKQLDEAEDRYNAFRNRNGTVDLTEESRLLLQQIVDNKTKLVDLQQQRIEMIQRFTESHPAVVALDSQISSLEAQQAQLGKRVGTLPDTEQSALRLLRDVRVNTQLYTSLLNNAQQLRILKAGQTGSVRVVDFAVAQIEPVKPKRPLVITLALLLGLVAGVTTVFARHSLFGGVEDSEEIEHVLGLPVYATIPHSDVQEQSKETDRSYGKNVKQMLAARAPNDVAIEGIRSLSTALQFGLLGTSNNIFVVTGPSPGIGKSFTAVNLAAILAAGGRRVLLVDGDMRRGDIHRQCGIARQPGLSNIIAGFDVNKAIVRETLPNLDVLPKGAIAPNPAELLMSTRFETLLEDFSSRYDLVIIDTPPILAVTDAALIGRHAAATLLVARHGCHPMPELVEAATRLRNAGVTLKGAVLTDVPRGTRGRATYYGYESVSE
ncbi:polysaccharide biosynthesis tyrosine autokinase [Paraburkholderia sp. J76]|uniref:polysaccharide biosynthesis tyrosine autokinase n=1 Tax=Paraburkholderia sp. J76 TaxID=2805439 RepID=UPI002ABE0E83|nr:polysaccharide biosynthesis tyrosine autokinase [Paraburkholderia sp. J76]